MNRTTKLILALVCIISLIMAVNILTRGDSSSSDSAPSQELTVGYRCTTDASDLEKTHTEDSITSIRTFKHSIYTSEGSKLTDLSVTVTGNVSPSLCAVSHLSALLSQQQWDGLTVTEHTVADTATIILFHDQLSVCHFQYRVTADGEIIFLQ